MFARMKWFPWFVLCGTLLGSIVAETRTGNDDYYLNMYGSYSDCSNDGYPALTCNGQTTLLSDIGWYNVTSFGNQIKSVRLGAHVRSTGRGS